MSDFFKGYLSLVKTQSNVDNPTPVRIELEDVDSGCRVLDIRLSLDEFADALLGRAQVACQFKLIAPERVGMTSIHKRVLIQVAEYGKKAVPEAMVKLAEYTNQGWAYHERDLENGHNFSRLRIPDGSDVNDDPGWNISVGLWKFVETDSPEHLEWKADRTAEEKLRAAEREERESKRKRKGKK